MTDTITLTGIVATIPRVVTTGDELAITSFRLASTQRRFDRNRNRWVDGDTNWYTVTAFRQLATNAASSVMRGDRVIVTGRLRIREWEAGERKGTTVEVEADGVGHDLTWGTTSFTRVITTSATARHDDAPGDDGQNDGHDGGRDLATGAAETWATPGVRSGSTDEGADVDAGRGSEAEPTRRATAVGYADEETPTPF
jgi:single-strand DNA-binding protein